MSETLRLFAAVQPPVEAVDHLEGFLAPRRGADADLRWSPPEQWHVTLAFAGEVPAYLLDDVVDRLAAAAARRRAVPTSIRGGGAFPDPDRARVLWAGLALDEPAAADLAALSAGCRTAFATAGAAVDGARFRPHVTLARPRRPASVMRWLRVLDAYDGPAWTAGHVALVSSHLGEGPRRAPRYETVAILPLSAPPVEARA